jgi:hypothetical protein
VTLRFKNWILLEFLINHLPQFEDRCLQNIQALLQLRREPLLLAEVLSERLRWLHGVDRPDPASCVSHSLGGRASKYRTKCYPIFT